MSCKRVIVFAAFLLVPFIYYVEASANAIPASVECDYIQSAGAVSDGEYIWTIPYETDSFSMINVHTGRKEKLSKYSNYEELRGLSGYLCGAFYKDKNGGKFLYLIPFEVTKPLARINLENMKIDYPIRNVGYYYGSCQMVSENDVDYLWIFPCKTKPYGTPSETEIVKLNLSENRKELSIPAKINNNSISFSSTVKAGDSIWLLPNAQGQPLIRLDVRAAEAGLDSDYNKKIYSSGALNFSRISTAVFDGSCVWFVCEDVSFMFNDCVLARCDLEGNLIEKIPLSKDRYLKSAFDSKNIYFFAGADGMLSKSVRIDTASGRKEMFSTSGKKGYIPAEAIVCSNSSIYILPLTKDGRKMPMIKLVEAPETVISANLDEKLYRDYGDMSKGCELKLSFNAPEGFNAASISWFASGEELMGNETLESFNKEFSEAETSERKRQKFNGFDELTVLAAKNGNYRFMTEYVSEDGETSLYSFCNQYVDNIFERLPITISRYDIENWDDASIIERVTRKKDFGAAFSFDGDEYLKIDAPMDLIPSTEVFAKGLPWKIETPNYHTISLSDGSVSPDSYYADVDVLYRIVKTEPLIEGNLLPPEPTDVSQEKSAGSMDDETEAKSIVYKSSIDNYENIYNDEAIIVNHNDASEPISEY